MTLQIADEDAERGNKTDRLIILTDNQAAIWTFQNPTGRSGAYFVADAIQVIDKVQGKWGLRVEIRPIPASAETKPRIEWPREQPNKRQELATSTRTSHRQGHNHLQATLKT